MRIIYFYQYFGTTKGSWSTRVYELTRRWVADGHVVTVVTSPYDKSDVIGHGFISRQQIEGIRLIVINSGDSNRFNIIKRVFRALGFAITSTFFALTLSYDVLISSSGPITVGVPMIFARIFRKKQTVFEVRDLWPAGGIEMGLIKYKWQKVLALWFEKRCYNSSDLIVTASIGQKNYIFKKFKAKPILVIPNAADFELFSKMPKGGHLPIWTNGSFIFTHIGSLGLIHNTKYWLKVAQELSWIDKKKLIKLIFIGDGSDKEELIRASQDLGLKNIYFLGSKPKFELPLWIKNSCATLFATLDNPVQNACSPNKIFDSFAAGVPIVQTSSGWIRDLVEIYNCGINVSLNNPRETAEKLIWMTENTDFVSEMGQNAKELARTQFDRDDLARKYLEKLLEISE